MMKRICVFCGSSPGSRPDYVQAGRELGEFLAKKGLGLVYGGTNIGIMGEVANAALTAGGEVIGVIPRGLVEKGIGHTGLTDLRVVNSMHDRKAMMFTLSDGFVALPGGLGTIEEFFEVLTWTQLGMHAKPCGLLNVQGYYDKLIAFLDNAVSERFVRDSHRAMVLVAERPEALIEKFESYEAPRVKKWLDLNAGGAPIE